MKSAAVIASLLLTQTFAQCGPNKDKPMPDGATTCPTKSTAGGMAAETGTAPGGGSSAATACTAYPCAASLLGDVALTTVAGTGLDGTSFSVGENIYGPFEAGFTSTQDNILKTLGCTDANVANAYMPGGIDTHTAEQMTAKACSVTLPRSDGDLYVSLIDECGGHTKEYHFHERLSCLYTEAGAHSTQIGQGMDGKGLYGKWENFGTSLLPKLDACGGHFGTTPDSEGAKKYHYHVQTAAPFTIGCFGPAKNEAGAETLVTLAQCRALYDGCAESTTTEKLETTSGTVDYKYWCPCYDADGSSVGSKEHAVFSDVDAVTCTDCIQTGVAASEVTATSSTNPTGAGSGSERVKWSVASVLVAFAFSALVN